MKRFGMVLIMLLMMTAQVEAISSEDAHFALDTITQKLHEWHCTPLKIWYAGDECNNAENIKYMNDLAEGQGFEKKFTECMVFYTDFRSPKDDGQPSAWNYDTDYKNWSWFFGRYDDGEWRLLTWGY